MATPEQERLWIAELDKRSVEQVRRMRAQAEIPQAFVFATEQWLSEKEREAEHRSEASNSEQIALARRASEAAERQAAAAERANTRATIALIIAIVSIIATTATALFSIWITRK
jgi:hypothetical protein